MLLFISVYKYLNKYVKSLNCPLLSVKCFSVRWTIVSAVQKIMVRISVLLGCFISAEHILIFFISQYTW